MADLALQRKNMVESQVRPSDVTDRRITAAMMRIPREKFVPDHLATLAYMDDTLPTGGGRALLAPRVLARLIQLADISENEKVLIAGVGSGYAAAILSALAADVTMLDSDAGARERHDPLFKDLSIANVTVVSGPLEAGWQQRAPYNAILLDGFVETIPEVLTAQLSPNGRLVALMPEDGVTRAVLHRKTNGAFTRRAVFEASGPDLPGFKQKPSFKF